MVGLVVIAAPVYAFTPTIQTLPGYVNTDTFKVSCTANGNSAQFSFKKEGGSYVTFGSAIDLSTTACQVQVTSSQVNEETKYYFKVTVDGVDSSEVSTTFDRSGTGPVSGYYKERTNDGQYKLHWKNPSETDFDKVVIYRGESADFTADNTHEIARVNGSPNSEMTYDDNFAPDANKNYFYIIRALDHAGNSSSIVGDGGTTTTTVQSTSKPTTSKVATLPKEDSSGSVLGTETSVDQTNIESTPAPKANEEATEASQKNAVLDWILTHKKLTLGAALAAVLAFIFLKFRSKK